MHTALDGWIKSRWLEGNGADSEELSLVRDGREGARWWEKSSNPSWSQPLDVLDCPQLGPSCPCPHASLQLLTSLYLYRLNPSFVVPGWASLLFPLASVPKGTIQCFHYLCGRILHDSEMPYVSFLFRPTKFGAWHADIEGLSVWINVS